MSSSTTDATTIAGIGVGMGVAGGSVAVGGTAVGGTAVAVAVAVDTGVAVGVAVRVAVGVDVRVAVRTAVASGEPPSSDEPPLGASPLDGTGVAVAVAVAVGVLVAAAVPPQSARLTVLVSSVTAAVRASARPTMLAPVLRVMLSWARMLPRNSVVVPRTAEEPIRKKTLHAAAATGAVPEFRMTTREAAAVVRVEPVLKIKVEVGLPWAFSVSVPVNCADVSKQKTPGVSVPTVPRSWPVRFWVHG